MLSQEEIAFTPPISTMAFRLSDMLSFLQKDYSVMQFTGLTDKNGKEIYEGDVLKRYGEIAVVEWNNDQCGFMPLNNYNHCCGREGDWSGDGGDIEVVGNIYENPELLDNL
jgi:YopX protein.